MISDAVFNASRSTSSHVWDLSSWDSKLVFLAILLAVALVLSLWIFRDCIAGDLNLYSPGLLSGNIAHAASQTWL